MAASAAIGLHFLAVVSGPLSLPPSVLGSSLRGFFRPYLEFAWLDHAYKFFAPDPGPSHTIRYEAELADGSRVEGRFPDLESQWPRLLYHRHFMLSEFLGGFEPDPESETMPDWKDLPLSPRQEQYARSYAQHLLQRLDARHVTLYLLQHGIPAPQQVLQGMKLDDRRLFAERQLYELGRGAG